MCILFLYVNADASSSEYKLIVASNRDEYFKRPTLPAHNWIENDFIVYSGRDTLEPTANGSWLAISSKNDMIKFSSVLNISGHNMENAKSRGLLVTDSVTTDQSNVDFLDNILNENDIRSGFNLVLTEINNKNASIVQYNNVTKIRLKLAERTAHVFGNIPPPEQSKKCENGAKIFNEILAKNCNKIELKMELLQMLKDPKKYWPDEAILKRTPDKAEHLSSIFVQIPDVGYGTRTHTVILIDGNNEMDYYEETLIDPITSEWRKTSFKRSI